MRSRAAWQDLDPADLFLQVEVGDQFLYEREHLIMGLSYALSKSVRATAPLNDSDLIAALTALAKTYETLVNSGLHYEAPISGVGRQAVTAEVQSHAEGISRRRAEASGVRPACATPMCCAPWCFWCAWPTDAPRAGRSRALLRTSCLPSFRRKRRQSPRRRKREPDYYTVDESRTSGKPDLPFCHPEARVFCGPKDLWISPAAPVAHAECIGPSSGVARLASDSAASGRQVMLRFTQG